MIVDDEPDVLAAMRNLLHRDRAKWDVVLAGSGAAAIDENRRHPVDVIVTDMRMPEMDGATLLQHIRNESPRTARVLLSGQADRASIGRALPYLHQLLSKPCDAATLRATIERSLDLAKAGTGERVVNAIAGIDRLPSPPDVYFEIRRVADVPTSGLGDIAKIVLRDPALAAKVLQLVNSAYFGARRQTTSIEQAVGMLGSDQLRFIALATAAYSSEGAATPAWIVALQDSAYEVSSLARRMLSGPDAETAFAAGLLQDVGQLVIAKAIGEAHAEIRTADPALVPGLETAAFGATHPEVGAWLLALWGLPNRLVDVVRAHHDPAGAQAENAVIASAVYVAGVVARGGTVDEDVLARAGTREQLAGWLSKVAAR